MSTSSIHSMLHRTDVGVARQSGHEFPVDLAPPRSMAAFLREGPSGVDIENFLNDIAPGLTTTECLLMLDSATMQLYWFGRSSAEAARLAALPWSTARDEAIRDQLIDGVRERRQERGVPDSTVFHIGNPSPNVVSVALHRFNTVIVDAQCEAATFAVAALDADEECLVNFRQNVERFAHGDSVAVIAEAIMQGVVSYAIQLAGREALSRVHRETPTWGTPLAPQQQAASEAAAPATAVD